MKKNKGFTLIELLATIIILAGIALVAFPILLNTIKNSENKIDGTTRKLVESAAKLYVDNNLNDYQKEADAKYCISIDTLVKNNFLNKAIIEQNQALEINNMIKVNYDAETYKFKYEIVNSCSICEAVTNSTLTVGNIPEGNYNNGDEYLCEVKPGSEYHFFVVSKDDNKVNLIMDSNINSRGEPVNRVLENKGLVSWVSKNDFINAGGLEKDWYVDGNGEFGTGLKGPITALNYLNNATKDWSNILNLNEEYTNVFANCMLNPCPEVKFSLTGKARLLKPGEFNCVDEGNCKDAYPWLITNLDTPGSETLGGVYSYWTLQLYSFRDAFDMAYNGFDTDGLETILVDGVREENKLVDGVALDYYSGVRPVISIEKKLIKNN